MTRNKLEELLLAEFRDLKTDVKDIRQKDIPEIRADIAVVKDRASQRAMLIAGVGGLISTATAVAAAYLMK